MVLCTDSTELQTLAEGWGFPVLMTAESCNSGSERIASVAHSLMALGWGDADPVAEETAVINVQGDQPFIDPAVIDAMAEEFRRQDPVPAVVTPVYGLKPESVHNPNVVKTLLAHDGRALYFSRSAIPHVRDVAEADWHQHTTYWGHVGMYGFRGDVLGCLGSAAGLTAGGSGTARTAAADRGRPHHCHLSGSRAPRCRWTLPSSWNRPGRWSDLSRCGLSSRRGSVVPSVHAP